MKTLDLSGISSSQLLTIRKVLTAGVTAQAEKDGDAADNKSYLCHKSPPKGYPKEKSEYADPECYRYPLNTKSRCLAAWRYVHQQKNKTILGSKWSKIVSKIKSYAKSHYNLELESGEAELIDWEKAFVEYYDGETMGERCDFIELEDDATREEIMSEIKQEDFDKVKNDLTAATSELESVKEELGNTKTELEAKSTELESLTTQLNEQKEELESLRKFKQDTDEAAEREQKLNDIKAKLEEANVDDDVDADPDFWLSQSDDNLDKIIERLKAKKEADSETASASIKVPRLNRSDTDAKSIASEGLKEIKKNRGDK